MSEKGDSLNCRKPKISKWDQILKNPMTAAAAIDWRGHHAVILELNQPSDRAEKAMEKQRGHAATEAGQP